MGPCRSRSVRSSQSSARRRPRFRAAPAWTVLWNISDLQTTRWSCRVDTRQKRYVFHLPMEVPPRVGQACPGPSPQLRARRGLSAQVAAGLLAHPPGSLRGLSQP